MSSDSPRLSAGQIETILAAASTGAAWAFDALYRDFAPSVSGYLRVQGAWDPEDLCSEVFLAVFKGLDAFRGGDREFRAWLFSIAHHRVVDERRRRSRRVVEVVRDEVAPGPVAASETEARAIASVEAERIERLCRRLSADQRHVILLRLVADLSLEETAQALGKTTGAVKALQHRGLQTLKTVLNAEIVGEGVSR